MDDAKIKNSYKLKTRSIQKKHKEEYNYFKSKLKVEINKAKISWTISHSSNAASFWNVINDLTGQKPISSMSKLIKEYNQNTDKLTNDK